MGKGKKITVGWKYFMGLHMIFCHGPVDEIQSISFGGREAWNGGVNPPTSSQDIYVDSPELFGGDEREGGIQGHVDICMGEETQGQNAYLASIVSSMVPAFRGVCGLVFKKFFIGSNNPYVKDVAVRLKRIKKGWNSGNGNPWYPEKADIAGAMNAAHIIYECLTDPEWAMGYPTSAIDDAQFKATADALFSEGFGLCLQWNQQATIEEFIQDVVNHVGGAVRTDPRTGLFQFKLFRDDYTVSSLVLFDENNIISLEEFERPNWGETTNEIALSYTDMLTGTKKTIYAQDLANIAIQSQVISAPREYPGIVSDDIASRIVVRDLKSVSSTLVKVVMIINRDAFDSIKGDVVRFNWADKGIIGMPLRILNVDTGTLTDGKVRIEAVEDLFGLPLTSYVNVSSPLWQNPSSPALDITSFISYETPYWDLATGLSSADFAQIDLYSAFLSAGASSPGSGQYGFSLSISDNNYILSDETEFCPSCLISSTIDKMATSVSYSSPIDIEEVDAGGYAYIGNELIEIVSINTTTNVISFNRGILDTVPEVHLSGSKIWFVDGYYATSIYEYAMNETASFKLRTISALGSLDISAATAHSLPLVGRFGKPYPPGNFKVNSSYFPASYVSLTGTINISWAHRNRVQQVAGFIDFTEGSITPETGVTYNLRITKVSTNAVLLDITGLTTSLYDASLPSGSYDIKIELESQRDGLNSFQKQQHIMNFTYAGASRSTEAGDTRITENGNERIVE